MYYPKSQIKTNLHTSGGELLDAFTKQPYTGDYYELSNGELYSGKNPNDKPTRLLIKANQNNNSFEGLSDYVKPTNTKFTPPLQTNEWVINDTSYLNSSQLQTTLIQNSPSFTPTPTQEEYEFGEIQRYFIKKRNELKYKEINFDEYKKYVSKNPNRPFQLFKPFSIPWEISGDKDKVYNTNKNTVERVSKNLKLVGFKSYLKEKYTKFYK